MAHAVDRNIGNRTSLSCTCIIDEYVDLEFFNLSNIGGVCDVEFDDIDLSTWRVGAYGGAPMPVAVIEQLAKHLPNLDLRNAYGATETTSPVTLIPAGMNDAHLDSVGRVLPCADVRIMNDAGQEVPFGETGELWINGPMVVPKYWDNPEASAKALDDRRWYRTGDYGRIADGVLYLESRMRDMIIRGGMNIYPREIEDILFGHEAVAEVAVLGIPDAKWGEVVAAVVRRADGIAALLAARAGA